LMAATTIKVVTFDRRKCLDYRLEANLRLEFGLELRGDGPIRVLD
jgi:hypothetical protein